MFGREYDMSRANKLAYISARVTPSNFGRALAISFFLLAVRVVDPHSAVAQGMDSNEAHLRRPMLEPSLAQSPDMPSQSVVENCARSLFQSSGAGPFGACRDFLELLSVEVTDSLIQGQSATIEATSFMRVKKPYNTGSVIAGSCGPDANGQARMLVANELVKAPITLRFQKWTSGWRCQ
jgi:hypothetical protein